MEIVINFKFFVKYCVCINLIFLIMNCVYFSEYYFVYVLYFCYILLLDLIIIIFVVRVCVMIFIVLLFSLELGCIVLRIIYIVVLVFWRII